MREELNKCVYVIHVSGHGDGKSGSVVRVGQLLGDFVDQPNATARVVAHQIRISSRDEIVKRATDWANNRFQICLKRNGNIFKTLHYRHRRMWRWSKNTTLFTHSKIRSYDSY